MKQKIVAKAIIEMLGSPKEHIEKTLAEYVKQIPKQYKGIKVTDNYISEAEEKLGEEKKLYSIFAEIEIEAKDLDILMGWAMDYMPASLEIMEPDVIELEPAVLTGFINDLLVKVHNIGNQLKRLSIVNETLGKNGFMLMKNIIKLQLVAGSKTATELASGAGVSEQDMQRFLERMENDKVIKKSGKKYFLQQNINNKASHTK